VTTRIDIPADEPATVRLFALDLPREEVRRMAVQPERAGWLADLLGVARLDAGHVETFDISDLGAMGLAGYLAEAHGVDEAVLEPDRPRLAAVQGPVMILRSAAFGGRAARLRPDRALILIGAWAEAAAAPPALAPLPGGTARAGARSDARTGGRVALAALAVMFALTAAVVWIGG
jgi:hypothetical protein